MSKANITDETWQATLDLIPKECIVHSREGGGPENLEASVAISISKLAMMYNRNKKLLALSNKMDKAILESSNA